ncbi:MAG: hypothetical protein R3Y56_05900 [Akkermansia sp.]
MSLSDDITDDFNALWEEMQCYVSFGGENENLKALVSMGESSYELELGGFSTVNDLSVRVLRNELVSFPKIGSLLAFDGNSYRIASISGKQNFPLLTLQCQQV